MLLQITCNPPTSAPTTAPTTAPTSSASASPHEIAGFAVIVGSAMLLLVVLYGYYFNTTVADGTDTVDPAKENPGVQLDMQKNADAPVTEPAA